MCQQSKLVYSPMYKVNVDLDDFYCTSAQNHDFGKRIVMYAGDTIRYTLNPKKRLYLHRIVADATVYNPRPDIFDTVDHKNGDRKNNNPSNLRWVNHHLNTNWQFHEGAMPPGVCTAKRRTKSGKWYQSIYFRKCSSIVKTFRTLQACVEFASKFQKENFNRLYEAYVNSPRDEFESRKYWEERLITEDDFRCDVRKSRKLVLAFEKFLVSDNIYRKLTWKA